MSSNKLLPPLPGVVPERESLIVRHWAEHLEGLGLSDRATGSMSGTASHVTAWLVASGLDLGTFDIRLVDRFMRPERPRCDRQHPQGLAVAGAPVAPHQGNAPSPDSAEKLGTISEWRSPGLEEGRFACMKDELTAIPSNVWARTLMGT